MLLTQEELHRILDYDPETGIFIWSWRDDRKENWNNRYVGTRAGYIVNLNGKLYRSITIDYMHYLEHHLAWWYVYGYKPQMIDHKNDDGQFNAISNLRECTEQQNMANKIHVKFGVEKHGRRYRARITVGGIKHELGSFDNEEQAKLAYITAAEKYNGEFAGHNRP